MYKIRGLALHADPPASRGEFREYLEELEDGARLLEEVSRRLSGEFEILSTRLVLPPVERLEAGVGALGIRELVELDELAKSEGVDLVALPLASMERREVLDLVPEALGETERLYISVRLGEEADLMRASSLMKEVSERAGWTAPCRFAYSLGEQPVTPYFPVTRSERHCLTACLLYASELSEEAKRGGVRRVGERVREIALAVRGKCERACEEVRVAFSGLDLSISPWMEESVVPLLEEIKGGPLGVPGNFYALYELNKSLREIGEEVGAIGFNEVMLPLAEDEGLKERAKTGEIAFRDLLALVAVCVAGLDMVPIPSWTDDRAIAGVLRDLGAFRRLKGRTVGVRLIPVGVEAGEEVDLGEFGKTPVLDVLG